MEHSADQLLAAENGETVPVIVEQTYPLTDETFRAGWESPGMADYDRYDELIDQ